MKVNFNEKLKVLQEGRDFCYNNFDVVKSSIETTISELDDLKDALEEKGEDSSAIQRTIDAYEELRRNLFNKNLSLFNISQVYTILNHRVEIFEVKMNKINRAKDELNKYVNNLGNILKNLN